MHCWWAMRSTRYVLLVASRGLSLRTCSWKPAKLGVISWSIFMDSTFMSASSNSSSSTSSSSGSIMEVVFARVATGGPPVFFHMFTRVGWLLSASDDLALGMSDLLLWRLSAVPTLSENGLLGDVTGGVVLMDPLRAWVDPMAATLLPIDPRAEMMLGTGCFLPQLMARVGGASVFLLSRLSSESGVLGASSSLTLLVRLRSWLALGLRTRRPRSSFRMLGRRVSPRLIESFFRKLPLVIFSMSISRMLGKLRRRVPQVAALDTMESLSWHSLSIFWMAAFEVWGWWRSIEI